jgi:hypothetical protein
VRSPLRLLPALVLVLVLPACGGGDDDGVATATTAPSASSSPSASPAPSASASTSPTPPSGPTTARAVYWIGAADDPRGPRLYREFVRRADEGEPVRDALEVMLAQSPSDPDHSSLWADGTTVLDVTRDGSVAVVDLSAQARTNGGGSAFEAMTVQQLVHTATAADPSLTGVQLRIDGRPTETLWGAVDTRGTLTRAPQAQVLAPVWLDVPEGGTIDGTFGGTATVFEATVSWQVRQGDRVVDEGFSTASVGAPERGTWTATTDVPPGDYELWAFESSAKDGSMQFVDTKQVTIT